MAHPSLFIDALQYNNWSEEIFKQINQGGLSAVHVTICYHEDFQEMVQNVIDWNRRFEDYSNLIFLGRTAADVRKAQKEGRTAIFFGYQNCSPIEDNIGLVEVCHQLGARFMQLTYNNQSLLGTGCYEENDPGITRMGKQVIKEMNRVGLVVDMSHSSERSTLEAIEISERPIAITHANPTFWHPALRNKSNEVLKALGESNSMLGFSVYPHHLKDGSDCTLESFCNMIADTAEIMGMNNIGIGTDLCQNQPDSVVEWMRNGTWTNDRDFGEGSASFAGFPDQPGWFRDNRDFVNISNGFTYSSFNQDVEYSNQPQLIVGKWTGNGGASLSMKAFYDGKPIIKNVAISENDFIEVDSNLQRIWNGIDIESIQDDNSLSNADKQDIISQSMDYRVLSKFTAFLALEPWMVIDNNDDDDQECVNCEFSVTSLSDLNDIAIDVFPNPSNDLFSIKTTASLETEKVIIQILDLNGNQIFKDDVTTNEFGSYQFGDELSPGVYILQIIIGNGVKTIKIVKE